MKQFGSRSEIIAEIKRIETAIKKTKSKTLERDYRKYLSRLHNELRRMHA